MKGRGIAALAAVAALGCQAAASFDLALVLDAGNRAVHRFDGDTGTYLGRINLPVNGVLNSMTIDQSTNRMFVTVGTNIAVYNYNTGQLLFVNGNFSFLNCVTYVEGTGLLLGRTANFVQVVPDLTASTTTGQIGFNFGPSSTTLSGVNRDSTGDYLALSSSGSLLRGVGTTVEASNTLLASGVRRLAVRGTQFMATAPVGNRLYYGNTQSIGSINDSTINLAGIQSVQATAFGHENIRYVVGRNSGNTSGVVHQFSATSSGFPQLTTRVMGEGILDNPIDIAVVVAPEPGTMIALGAGVLALLRRRVRKG